MSRNTSIKLKAAFLMIVFATNTLIGFACAMGVNMGFNTHHHDEETAAVNTAHHHEEEELRTNSGQVSIAPVENCCNKTVSQLAQADKAVPQSFQFVNPIFTTSFLASFYNIDVLYAHLQIPNIKYFLQNYHPPIPDIRIAVKSFQI